MPRRKKYKDGELEREFNKYMFQHIYVKIRTALGAFTDKEIVDSEIVTTLFGKLKGSYVQKMEKICNSVIELHDTGHDQDLMPLYEYCWSLVAPKLTDNFQYNE